MTTPTLTLTDFLLARIAEDESLVVNDPPSDTFRPWELTQIDDSRSWDLLAMSHRRVLAECEAKRLAVEWASMEPGDDQVMCFLALPYADHPNYQQEWRP